MAFDPVAMLNAKTLLADDGVEYARNAYEACEGAHAVLILTEWTEFAAMDWLRVQKALRLPIVLDGKNLLDPQVIHKAGLHYFGVGVSSGQRPMAQGRKHDDPREVFASSESTVERIGSDYTEAAS